MSDYVKIGGNPERWPKQVLVKYQADKYAEWHELLADLDLPIKIVSLTGGGNMVLKKFMVTNYSEDMVLPLALGWEDYESQPPLYVSYHYEPQCSPPFMSYEQINEEAMDMIEQIVGTSTQKLIILFTAGRYRHWKTSGFWKKAIIDKLCEKVKDVSIIATTPLTFEGERKALFADSQIELMKSVCNDVRVINGKNIENTSMDSSFFTIFEQMDELMLEQVVKILSEYGNQ